jgi:5-formyltetrahydrofolate cyclo-ligase
VLAFVSISSEVPTSMLLGATLEAGKTLLLPYVAEDGALRAAAVSSLAELQPGYRGIPEPRARLPVDPASAGVIVAPGVAFDARGGRLGYGGGFYDAFLRAAAGVPRVGICFEVQLVDEVPMAEHDERVDVVVTEERVVRAAPGR